MSSTLDSRIESIKSMAGTFSADEIAEELDVTVSHLKQFCSREGISLARRPEAKKKYKLELCINHQRCGNTFRQTHKGHRMCDKCRQGSLTVFDVCHRGRP